MNDYAPVGPQSPFKGLHHILVREERYNLCLGRSPAHRALLELLIRLRTLANYKTAMLRDLPNNDMKRPVEDMRDYAS